MTDTRTLQKGLVLALPAVVFGFFVATQWATFAVPATRDVEIRYIDPLGATVTTLQNEQAELRSQLGDIRAKLDDLQRASGEQSGSVRDLQTKIDDLRTTAGLTEVRGEGVQVTLDSRPGTGADVRPPCFAPDLTDIVNAAWRGGATAVSIAGERVVSSSSVYCVGGTIVVNGSIVSAPLTVAAVGPTASLFAILDDPAQLKDLKRRRDDRSVDFRYSRAQLVVVPAYRGAVAVAGERVVSSSSVYCVGGTIVVNGSIVSAPLTVAAAGPTASLFAILDDPAQLKDLKRRRDDRSIDFRYSRAPLVVIPAYRGAVAVRTATPQ